MARAAVGPPGGSRIHGSDACASATRRRGLIPALRPPWRWIFLIPETQGASSRVRKAPFPLLHPMAEVRAQVTQKQWRLARNFR